MTRVLGLLFWTWNGNIANNLGKTIVGVHIFGKLENINSQKTIQKKNMLEQRILWEKDQKHKNQQKLHKYYIDHNTMVEPTCKLSCNVRERMG
jgi:hypothetical protein